jgi:polyisoprenyl-phosphate glycosyltransferase
VTPLELSVVIPMYNEEEVLPQLVERLRPVLDGLVCNYEVIAVDDSSSDGTAVLLQRERHHWPQLRVLRLRANAGHQAAISAALASARGNYVVTLDADLQDPPEVIPRMLEVARRDGVDVVYGVRSDRSTDSMFKRHTATLFYRLIAWLSGTTGPQSAGDYRLLSRATVEAVNALPAQHRVLRLVVPALNFPSGTVDYKREPRAAGASKYTLAKMIRLAADSFTSSTIGPLRLATWFGLIGTLGAIGLFGYALFGQIFDDPAPGWASILGAMAAFGALQLLSLGLLGEYVGRIYVMLQGRPTYSIAYDSLGSDVPDAPAQLAAVNEQDESALSQPLRSADRSPMRADAAGTRARPGSRHGGS